MGKVKLVVIVLVLAAIAYFVFVNSGAFLDWDSLFKEKPVYTCTNEGCDKISFEDLNGMTKNCEEIIVILESPSTDMKIEQSKLADTCRVGYTVIRSSASQLNNKSMVCDFPLDKYKEIAENFSQYAGFLKYCNGELKEIMNNPSSVLK